LSNTSPEPFAIAVPRLFDGEDWHENRAVIVEDGQVRAVVRVEDLPSGLRTERPDHGFLAPGLVDLQVNGGGGVLLNDNPTAERIRTICGAHAQFGVTSLLPTLITDTDAVRRTAIEARIEAARIGVPGFSGLHLEGPHLAPSRAGAHDPSLMRPMTESDVALLADAGRQLPALIATVAPEAVTPEQVRALVQAGVVVSIGHSDATMKEVEALADAGARLVTHLFNAMSQIGVREPGVVGAALNSESLSAGLICDGHHVHPENIRLALRAKQGPGRMFLVSDAMPFAGTEMTEMSLNGRRVRRIDGALRLDDGTLAGADLDLATAMRVLHGQVGIELAEALRMASLYPAEAAGIEGAGVIRPGGRADFVLFDDDLNPVASWICSSGSG